MVFTRTERVRLALNHLLFYQPHTFSGPSNEKAFELLKAVVSEREWRFFLMTRTLKIEGPQTGLIYIVSHNQRTRIYRSAFQRWPKWPRILLETACIQFIDGNIPRYDRMLMEYLLIRNDEEKYRHTAVLVMKTD